jgi:predicted nucleotidyltransferase
MNPRLNITDDQLAAFCRKWKIVRLWLFGSVLRDDFRPTSDIDVMVEFADDAKWTLFDFVYIREDLMAQVGRKVDLLTRRGVEDCSNPYKKEAILTSAEMVYAA